LGPPNLRPCGWRLATTTIATNPQKRASCNGFFEAKWRILNDLMEFVASLHEQLHEQQRGFATQRSTGLFEASGGKIGHIGGWPQGLVKQ
jgi:hypothetical protein